MNDPRSATVREAVRLVRTILGELSGGTASPRKTVVLGPRGASPLRLRSFEARARRNGYAEISRHAILPATGGGFVLADCRDARVFARSLDLLTLSRRRWRVARGFLRAAARLGVTPVRWLPTVILAARETAHLRFLAISSGVPGPSQKLVACYEPAHGPVAILKVGIKAESRTLVEHEVEALRWLARDPKTSYLGPALRHHGVAAGATYVDMDYLSGTRPHNRFGARCASFVQSLHAAQEPDSLGFERWHAGARASIAGLRQGGGSAPVDLLSDALADVHTSSLRHSAVCMPAHGDLTPWNSRLRASDDLVAFDWEHFRPSAPAWYDLFHWSTQTGILVTGQPPEQIIADSRRAWRVANASEARPDDRFAFYYCAYLIDVIIRDELAFLVEEPDFPQRGWLATKRQAILRHLVPQLSVT
jgi:hypothetical protein